jgi:hypothetical protein
MSELAQTQGAEHASHAAGAALSLRRIVPVACALAYPFALQSLSSLLVLAHGSTSPDGVALWFAVAGSLLLAFAVMAAAFASARTAADGSTRAAAHLAFATPSLFVGFNNATNFFHLPQLAIFAWLIFWAAAGIIVLAPRKPRHLLSPLDTGTYRRLGIAHGISALFILGLFIAPHLANHLTGVLSGATHIEFMKTARRIYRAAAIEPLLLSVILFQVTSGAFLVRRRLAVANDFFGTVQTMTGVYIGIYFLAHLIAVFGARYAGTDTNWNWLTNNDHNMLASLSNLRLLAHYSFGPIAIVTHLGCGLRLVLRQHGVSASSADLAPRLAIPAGIAVSSVILVALLGVRIS